MKFIALLVTSVFMLLGVTAFAANNNANGDTSAYAISIYNETDIPFTLSKSASPPSQNPINVLKSDVQPNRQNAGVFIEGTKDSAGNINAAFIMDVSGGAKNKNPAKPVVLYQATPTSVSGGVEPSCVLDVINPVGKAEKVYIAVFDVGDKRDDAQVYITYAPSSYCYE